MRYTRVSIKIAIILLITNIVIVNSDHLKKETDEVVLIAPVLAPPKSSRAIITETAKDFPVLMLLATDDKAVKDDNAVSKDAEDATDHAEDHQPVYVKKIKDQEGNGRRRRSQVYFFHKNQNENKKIKTYLLSKLK